MDPFSRIGNDFPVLRPKFVSGPTQMQSGNFPAGERFEASGFGADPGLMRGPRQSGMRPATTAWLQTVERERKQGFDFEEALKLRDAELGRQRIIVDQMLDALGLPKEEAPKPAPQIPPWEAR